MIDRTTRLRWRRRFRRSRRQVEDMGTTAEDSLERLFFRRLNRLAKVRRFIVSWVLLLILLIGGVIMQTRALGSYYQALKPVPGGIYSEGHTGTFTNANPLYAVSGVDSAVSRLLFAGLFKYNQNNELVGDLAEKFTVDEKGATYAVTLREGLQWHDGKPVTTDDVLFTYSAIQNPDAKSPLAGSWQSVKLEALDKRTIVFTLPNALSAFPHSMTNGIVPKHLLQGVPMAQLRSVSFNNTNPVGTGPFKWGSVDVSGSSIADREQSVSLVPYERYHHGQPKLTRFIIRTFTDEKRLLKNFTDKQLNAVVGLEVMPDEFKNDAELKEYNIPLTGGVYVFFKSGHEILADTKVRRALVQSVNTQDVIGGLGFPVVPVRSPFLDNHIGFNKDLVQLPHNVQEANKLLDESGWKMDADGVRKKNNKPLTFRLYSQSTSEYAYVTQVLQRQWRAVGVNAEVLLQPDTDLQGTISRHDYDALLYGVAIGVDPDVFAYWHSSQADLRLRTRLNFSEYKSTPADKALEAGRTRSDPGLRALKYQPFLQAWRNDAPALALYQPRFLYITRGPVFGFEPKVFNTGIDRFNNVHELMIRQTRSTQ